MKTINGKWFAENKLYTLLFAIIGITNFIMLITFEYCDLDSLTAWTFDFWDLFFQGRLGDFYEYAALKIHGAYHVNCGGTYLWLLPWCVWNLPLWIIHSLNGVVLVTNFWSLCWSKLFLFLLQWVMAHYTAKICMLFTTEKRKIMLVYFFIFASPEVLMSVGYAGQDEILYMSLFVMGLYYAFCGQKKKAYALMVAVVAFCPIMLLPVLALFVMLEKNIIKIGTLAFGTVIPLLIFELIYRNDMAYQSAKGLNDFFEMIRSMMQGSILEGRVGKISIGGILLVIVYFISYQIRAKDEGFNQKVICSQVAVFSIIGFLMSTEYYRLFLYVPPLVVFILISEQNERINFFLLTVLTYCRTFVACATNIPQNMNTEYVMRNSWVTKLCDLAGSAKYKTENRICLYDFWARGEQMETILLIALPCAIASMFILFAINFPGTKKKYDVEIAPWICNVAYCACMPIVLGLFFIMLLR